MLSLVLTGIRQPPAAANLQRGEVVPPHGVETSPIPFRQAGRQGKRTPRSAAFIGALSAIASVAGCASYVHTPYLPADAPVRSALVRVAAGEFDYMDHWPDPRHPIVEEGRDYRVRSFAFASVGENGQEGNLVTGRYYQGKDPGPKPLVIVLPVWGVHSYPSETISAGLRERASGAVNVLQIIGEELLFDWPAVGESASEAAFYRTLDAMVARFVATVIDIRRIVDWAETRPEADPDRIALIGFSIGAVIASVALANEPRLAAGVLVMGGADPHAILTACGREIAETRERVLAQLDWSLERLEGVLEVRLAKINPACYADTVDPARVLIIEAGADSCVPQSARDRLWQAFGRPERIAYRYDHRTAFLAMTLLGGYDLQRQVYQFLDRRFARRSSLRLTEDEGAPGRRARAGPG